MSNFDLFDKKCGSHYVLDIVLFIFLLLAFVSYFFVWVNAPEFEDDLYIYHVYNVTGMDVKSMDNLGGYRFIPLICLALMLIEVVLTVASKHICIAAKDLSAGSSSAGTGCSKYVHTVAKVINGETVAIFTAVVGILLIVLPVLFWSDFSGINWGRPVNMGVGEYLTIISGVFIAICGVISILKLRLNNKADAKPEGE